MKFLDIAPEYMQFTEAAAPSTPAAGVVRIYAKSDGLMYCMDNTGTETCLSNQSATAASVAVADAAEHFAGTDVETVLAELFTSVSDGKTLVAAAITDKGVPTAATDSFPTMATNISGISTGGGAMAEILMLTTTVGAAAKIE